MAVGGKERGGRRGRERGGRREKEREGGRERVGKREGREGERERETGKQRYDSFLAPKGDSKYLAFDPRKPSGGNLRTIPPPLPPPPPTFPPLPLVSHESNGKQ